MDDEEFFEVTARDGVRLVGGVRGPVDAPVIVAVHGYPDNRRLWDGIAGELADRYRFASYDVRGAGRSGEPPRRKGYRNDQLAADLDAVIDTVAPGRPVHLLAHDWGSIQTWHAVTGAGSASRAASYTSISGPCLDHVGRWFRRPLPDGSGPSAAERLRQAKDSWYVMAFQVPVLPELFWRSHRGQKMAAGLSRAGAGGRHTPHRPEPRDLRNGVQLYRANMMKQTMSPQPRATRVPVQVLMPGGDAFVTPPLQRAALFGAPQARFLDIEGGHWVVRDDPARIAGLVDAFVREHV